MGLPITKSLDDSMTVLIQVVWLCGSPDFANMHAKGFNAITSTENDILFEGQKKSKWVAIFMTKV